MKRVSSGVAVFLFVAVLVAVGNVVVTHAVFTSRFPGANDLYPYWRGAQLFWRDGIDPYSDDATLAIQKGIHGRPAHTDEDQNVFVYPFYVVFFLLPLIWLPYAWVQAIWMVFLEFSILAGVSIIIDLLEWRLPKWLMGLTALWALLFYHSARTILLGQFAGVVFLAAVSALWCLNNGHEVAAGIVLAVTTLKPQMSVFLIPALLLWGLSRRRWGLLLGFFISLGILTGISFLMLPGWAVAFLRQVTLYPSYTAIGSPVWIITRYYFPFLGPVGEMGFSILLLLYMFVQWRRLWGVAIGSKCFYWVLGVTLIVTNVVVIRTATTNYVIMYVPLFLALKAAVDRLPYGRWFLALFYVASIVAMWWLFVTTVAGRFENPILYLPLSFGLLLVFLTWRRWAKVPACGSSSAM